MLKQFTLANIMLYFIYNLMILTRANNQSVKHTRNKAADITHLEHMSLFICINLNILLFVCVLLNYYYLVITLSAITITVNR